MVRRREYGVFVTGERVRALRLRLGLTQEELGARSGLPRTKIVEIESGTNKAGSWAIRRGLAIGFRLRVETLADLLDGALSVDDAERRARAGEGDTTSGRLHDRPEWPTVLRAAREAAGVTDPDLGQEDFERVGLLYNGEAIPRSLTPRMILQLARALRSV
jgi:transcriptional regulator with XRE-family HTH domain